ncbi:BA14K family protein [Aurantimonas sp. VKM B-3413]|uniref:BA14K family protein n=1 Tax=Aurantimonas sp. VKM B-3413 TaxID=2779401 RepID=UPI001E311888|nr:BA14K family protein [Aurantimonas sp. VKM B-3413]MCB8839636.1 BA14K family protein [Aurantimonas sp. VKM B-3413]
MRKLLIMSTLAAFTATAALGAGTVTASADPWNHGWHHRGGHHDGWNRGYHRGYRGDRGWRHHNDGAALAAGIGGLALGALIGGAVASPRYYGPGYAPDYYYGRPVPVERVYPLHRVRPGVRSVSAEHVAACARHYKSYDARTDTFLGYDGRRHYCRY